MNIILKSKNFLFLIIFVTEARIPHINIKVLLKSVPLNEYQSYVFSSKNDLILACSDEPKKQYLFKNHLTIMQKNKQITIKNKKNKSKILRIHPIDGQIEYDNNKYLGTFYIHVTDNMVEIINKLPLEDYITSVLRTEGWPGWSSETYKVFAVACRTYAIYQLQQARKKGQRYHLKPTNAHQTYFGTHSCQTIKDAVKETEGIFLAYKNKPILAMFDSCCGGIIPSNISNSVNFKEAPYLARPYACTFCKNLKIYSWQKDYSITNFKKLLADPLPKIKTITHISVEHDKAGIVKQVIIKDGKKRFFLDGKKIYSLIPEVKSFAFTCTKKHNQITLKGTGYGHHIGLCQWGANELVKKGWHYNKILHFYYPGTHLMKLKPKDPKK